MKTIAKYASMIAAFAPLLVSAQAGGGVTSVTGGPGSLAGIWAIVNRVMNWVVAVFFLYATFQILMAGWTYLNAKGDTDQIAKAKDSLIWAAVGIAVGLLAFAVPAIVQNFLGVNLNATQ